MVIKWLTTSLPAAIDSVMALDLPEQTAFPERQCDPSVLDTRTGGSYSQSLTETARSKDYTGPEIQGPLIDWVKLAEGEDVATAGYSSGNASKKQNGFAATPV